MGFSQCEKELLKEIEYARNQMHLLSNSKQRTSREVVEISTYLDTLLNKYQQINVQQYKKAQ
ncbi:aspartyl-phosphate phosphatase Spo0E family protein [Bacillus shivajii]|uniref:aspartyl-phosphate phosphatase Spo0E family protein n=1 Tax=Bacillus shivajii TaxID=1983719 RepID=UPI001CFB366A|nr:aspartyl-phosphate phosphatase Spo0E family protein [Bacillus shivajii]UCZ53415.1 aspartyl-phosphate phosphatase Spo0E family protein [Bacillus shivajii]